MFNAKLAKGFLVVKLNHHFESFTVSTMTWLTVMEYLSHKWPRIWFVCLNHNSAISSFMAYHCVCNKSNMTGATSGAGTACLPFWSSPTVFSGVHVAWSLGFCTSLFVLFPLAIVLSAFLRFTACDNPLNLVSSNFSSSLWFYLHRLTALKASIDFVFANVSKIIITNT